MTNDGRSSLAAKPEADMQAIGILAEEIARASPDVADKALKIAALVRSVARQPDRGAIQDALEDKLIATDISDSRLHLTTSAVIDAMETSSREL